MASVVITGSSRGIGYGMVKAFLEKGHSAVVCGRSQESVDKAVETLRKVANKGSVFGTTVDITNGASLKNLWDFSVAHLGRVDLWINNAGIINPRGEIWDLSESEIFDTINTNLIGSALASRLVVRKMIDQGGGKLYNFEGFGSNGRQFQPGMSIYGTSKCGLRYLTSALVKETKGTSVVVGSLSPGIVVTELLWKPYVGRESDWERARKIFNILGDKVETVAPFLAEGALKNQKSGALISWLTVPRVLCRFIQALFRKRQLLSDKPLLSDGLGPSLVS